VSINMWVYLSDLRDNRIYGGFHISTTIGLFLLQSSGQRMPLGFRVERACEAVYGRLIGPQNALGSPHCSN
jgi:hypothetical protein